ncbi:MAG TPA: hypothetical protein VEV37_05850, partial [Bryobacteraceae bacterium]|nr:hypothetical protein [Bryobacteraceae bacterium]
RLPRVFASDQIRFPKDPQRAHTSVFEIANWRRDNVEGAGQSPSRLTRRCNSLIATCQYEALPVRIQVRANHGAGTHFPGCHQCCQRLDQVALNTQRRYSRLRIPRWCPFAAKTSAPRDETSNWNVSAPSRRSM